MLSQAKTPPPLKKYRGERRDVYLPDFFSFIFNGGWGEAGASVHSLDKNFFIKKGQIYAKPAHY